MSQLAKRWSLKLFSELKRGSKIRILSAPSGYLHKETLAVYKKIIKRSRPVRINKIDEYGNPWYTVKFRRKNGDWEEHMLNVIDEDNNWKFVKPRR